MFETSDPLVCICIPNYNNEKTIGKTLDSLLIQTYKNIIIKIFDNASTDSSLKIIREFEKKYNNIQVFESDQNIGAEANFEKCIQYMEGKYSTIYHSDDIYEPAIVEEQVHFLEKNPSVGAVFTEASLINQFDEIIGEIKLPKDLIKTGVAIYGFETLFRAILRHSNFFVCPSFMVKTAVYKNEIISWRGDLFKSSADLDVWLRILEKNNIGHISKPLIRYRLSESQWSSSVRRATSEADFFLVTEHYLAKVFVKKIVNKQDLSNYKGLIRRDKLMRAVNFYLEGLEKESLKLLKDVVGLEIIKKCCNSKRDTFAFLLAYYLKFIIFLRLKSFGRFSIIFLKTIFNK